MLKIYLWRTFGHGHVHLGEGTGPPKRAACIALENVNMSLSSTRKLDQH
jgi:hypothetical protein